jgi:hypothetical protein
MTRPKQVFLDQMLKGKYNIILADIALITTKKVKQKVIIFFEDGNKIPIPKNKFISKLGPRIVIASQHLHLPSGSQI